MTRQRLHRMDGQDSLLDITPIDDFETSWTIFWQVMSRDSDKSLNIIYKEYRNQSLVRNRPEMIIKQIKYLQDKKYPTVQLVNLVPGIPLQVLKRGGGSVGVLVALIRDSDTATSGSPDLQGDQQRRISKDEMISRLIKAAYIALQIAIIHDLGFVHGDLTPRNILMQKRGGQLLYPVVIDIDAAAVLKIDKHGRVSDQFRDGLEPIITLSTSMDMANSAPELVKRAAEHSQFTDRWSLATTLHYVLMTPRYPFTLYSKGSRSIETQTILDKANIPWPPVGHGVKTDEQDYQRYKACHMFVGKEIMSLFARVFDRPTGMLEFSAFNRPTPSEWLMALIERIEYLKRL